jgi:hypothetical protein
MKFEISQLFSTFVGLCVLSRSGYGSSRPKSMRIRIRNTAVMLCHVLCPLCVNTIVTCYFCWVCLCLCLGLQLCTGFAAVPWVDSCVLGPVLCPKSCAVPIACLPGYPCSCMCSQLCSMWTALVPYADSKMCPLFNVVNYIHMSAALS